MQDKKSFYVLVITILSLFSASTAVLAAGGEQVGPQAFNGLVFGLLLVFVVGLAAVVLYGSTKTAGAGKNAVKISKNNPKNRKR